MSGRESEVSVLLARLNKGAHLDPTEPAPRPKAGAHYQEVPVKVAFCHLLQDHNGTGMCGDADCGRCEILNDVLEDRQPDHSWLCSNCVQLREPQPYWTDGVCPGCGEYSIVLILAFP